MPEHPNSPGKGDGKLVLTGSDRNKARTPQADTVSPAVLLSSLSGSGRSRKEGGRGRFCPDGDAELGDAEIIA